MMPAMFLVVGFAVVAIAAAYAFKPKPQRLPAGPSGMPLVGNVLRYLEARKDPSKFVALLQEMASYGEMSTCLMGARTWVFLNSHRAVKEIIAKRSTVTAERPVFPVSSGLVSRDSRTVLKRTSRWLEGRKLMHHLLNGTSLKNYDAIQEEENTKLLISYLRSPQEWYSHHYAYAYNIIYRIVIGELPTHSQTQLDDFRRITVEFVASITASFFDFWPDVGLLQPGRSYWRRLGDTHNSVLKDWWLSAQKGVEKVRGKPSFVRDVLLKSNTVFARNDEEAMYLASSIVAAGSDNVRRAHNVLMMAMICHPDAFKKARSSVDHVCGDAARLPTIDDIASLPYISAIIKESLRWRPVVPVVPAHQSTQPIDFEGYHFPAGTDFVINSPAVASDIDGSHEFSPERWEGREMSITEDLWAFGGGRRVCVGYKIAHQELFLALASTIYCFDIVADGSIDNKRLNHHMIGAPFALRLIPRSEAHINLVENAFRKTC